MWLTWEKPGHLIYHYVGKNTREVWGQTADDKLCDIKILQTKHLSPSCNCTRSNCSPSPGTVCTIVCEGHPRLTPVLQYLIYYNIYYIYYIAYVVLPFCTETDSTTNHIGDSSSNKVEDEDNTLSRVSSLLALEEVNRWSFFHFRDLLAFLVPAHLEMHLKGTMDGNLLQWKSTSFSLRRTGGQYQDYVQPDFVDFYDQNWTNYPAAFNYIPLKI